jgi:hypothetical protein|tara:strand:+ start:1097 stop:1786 length:690 start_codon:yes stop_codon:yes gene_type:complete
MIFTWPFKVYNVADKLQISIGTASKGAQIRRDSRAELTQDGDGNYMITPHDTHAFLMKSNSNYFCLEGTMKVRYEWQDGDIFKQEHSDIYKELMIEHNKETNIEDNWNEGPGFIENTATKSYLGNTWRTSLVAYEPDCKAAEVTAMTDNTTLLCPMQYVTGWTFETLDILPNEQINSIKKGDEEYIIFGQKCKIGELEIPKQSIRKQTTQSLDIANDSSEVATLVRIYK